MFDYFYKKLYGQKYSVPPITTSDQITSIKSEKWKNIYDEFMKDFKDFSTELERRKYNMRIITCSFALIFGYATYGLFRNWASKEVVLISSRTFDDNQFKCNAVTFSKDSIKELVESEEVQTNVANLLEKSVIDVINRPVVQNKLVELLENAIRSEQIKSATNASTKSIIDDLVNHKDNADFRENVTSYVSTELQNQLSAPTMQQEFGRFIKAAVLSIFGKN